MKQANLCVCICTYQRVSLLRRLIDDLCGQTVLPDIVIIVDGDPDSGRVLAMLEGYRSFPILSFVYVPSNHANLAYQRYLGWRVAKVEACQILLYLDDDLSIEQPDAVENVIYPLINCNNIVGVTAYSTVGDLKNKLPDQAVLIDRSSINKNIPKFVHAFGSTKHIPTGGLSPVGNRRLPNLTHKDYEQVTWMYGRVMAYSMEVLREECFSNDLFAISEHGWGLGEDTFLSHIVSTYGTILLATNAVFIHPHDAPPNAYPTDAFQLGHTTAYSRRLLNDYYRGFDSPKFSDRYALVKSYFGNALLNIYRALTQPARHRFAYAAGYFLGALRGLVQKPTAENLTPEIDWREDAEQALQNVKIVKRK